MSTLQIQAITLPYWNDRRANVELWIFSGSDWTDVDGVPHGAGNPETNKLWTQRVTGLVVNTTAKTIAIPGFNLTSTRNGVANQSVLLFAHFMAINGQTATKISVFPNLAGGFQVPEILSSATACTPYGLCATWGDLVTYNLSCQQLPRDGFYTKAEVDAKIAAVSVVSTGVDLISDQTILGNKWFKGITRFGTQANINDAGWAGTGGISVMAHGADSSSIAPNSSGNASLTFQTWRSGGSVGVGVFGYQFGINRVSGQGDQYGVGVLMRYSPDMSAFTAGGTNYFQTGFKAHIVLSPTNIPSGANAIGFNHSMAERTVANVRAVAWQPEAVNNAATDADNDGSTIDSTIALNVAGGGAKHNSVGIQFEASRLTSFAIGIYPKRNSIHRFINDYTAAQFDLQGTVTVTNGSPTITGGGTSFIKEAVKGDQVGIDGVNWYEVASTPVSDTSLTLTTNYAGSTLAVQTLTKIVTPFRLLRPSFIAATDTINTYRLIGLDANNKVKLDPDGTGIYAGTTPVQITDTLGKLVPEFSETALSLVNGLNSNITLPALAGFVRQDGPSGAFSLGGFTNGRRSRVIVWFNATAQQMTIVNEDASSTAANRINTLTGGNVTLRAFQSCATFIYSGTDSRWVLVSTN